jgi:hypothetical protein
MAGAYETINEQLGEYLTYDAEATCTQRFPMGRIVCLQDDGDFAYCDEEEDEEEEEQEEEEEEDNGDDSTGEDNNDDTNNTDEDSNDDDEGRNNNDDNENGDNDGNDGDDSSPPNEESSAVRVISMGTLPMLIFKHMAQVIKAVGLHSGR